jgi:mannose-6-phosphate isomerase-like protein (cupin superfamily)
MKHKISLQDAIDTLNMEAELPFTVLMKHGTMTVEYFAPKEVDVQQPHLQDEIYIIASGSSNFFCDGKYFDCTRGDMLFVPAGMEHHFENFSENFATWVIFYGPVGGELIHASGQNI